MVSANMSINFYYTFTATVLFIFLCTMDSAVMLITF